MMIKGSMYWQIWWWGIKQPEKGAKSEKNGGIVGGVGELWYLCRIMQAKTSNMIEDRYEYISSDVAYNIAARAVEERDQDALCRKCISL